MAGGWTKASCRLRERRKTLTRRGFIANLASAGAAIAAASIAPVEMCAVARAPGPVVSIHMDQPYIDPTGRAIPYIPPAGLRSAASAADLSEAEFRSRHVYL